MSEFVKFTSDSRERIENFSLEKISTLLTLENTSELSQWLNSNSGKEAVKAVSHFLGDAAKQNYQAHFHESLNVFEKCGFIKKSKREMYERKNSAIGFGATIALPAIIGIAEFAVTGHSQKKQIDNFVDFFLEWTVYINQKKPSGLVRSNLIRILTIAGVDPDRIPIDQKAVAFLDKGVSSLPHLSSKNITHFNSQENDVLSIFAKYVIAASDLEDPNVKQRALEFIEDCFAVSHADAENKLNDVIGAQEYHKDMVGFSSVCYLSIFQRFAHSVKDAMEFGKYNVEMDIYAQHRENNKQIIYQYADELIKNSKKAIIAQDPIYLLDTLQLPKRQDLLSNSSQLMQKTLNPKGDVATGIGIMKAEVEMAKRIGVINE